MLKSLIQKINFNFKDKSISDKYFFVGFFIILFLVFLLTGLSIYQVKYRYKIENEQLKKYYLNAQKEIAKSKVDAALNIIEFKKKQTEKEAKSEIKERTYNAYNIALNIYKNYKNLKSKQEIKELIKHALRPVRFENGSDYYFIIDLNGTEILYPTNTKHENKNFIDLQDAYGNYVIREELKIARKYNEGFVKNFWKDNNKGSEMIYPGVSFVKMFKPLGWVIGTGIYINDMERKIQKEVINEIAAIRFGTEGYVFINKYNGDALITDGNVVTDSINLWEITDLNGVKVIQEERKAVENPEGDYIYYVWNKLSEPLPCKKISFLKGFPDWEWMVGSGVYLDEIDKIIEKQQAELKKEVYNQILIIVIVFILFSIVIYFIARSLATSINFNIKSLIKFLKKATTEYITIDVSKIEFSEFKLLAVAANKMIEERNKAYNDLSLEKAYFEELFESSPEAIVLTDNNSKLIRMNKKFSDMFGYIYKETLSKEIDSLIIPSHLKREAHEITLKVASGKVVFKESIRKRKDGKLIYVSILGTPVVIKGGQVAVYGIYRDIGEQKEYENSLKDAKEKAENAVTFQSAFLNNLSHEIRTPMNAIIGFSNLLGSAKNIQTRDKYVKLINDNSLSLLDIIEDILEVSKIEAGQQKLNFSECNVNDVLIELYKHFHSEIQLMNKDIDLFLKSPSEDKSFTISTDIDKFKQILNKLIVNAIKFTDKGFVEFGYFARMNNLVFYVKDTGKGISEDQFDLVFDRFRKIESDNSVLYGGTGLGLTISKKLVEMLHGRIWVESELNKGSTFYFSLPKRR